MISLRRTIVAALCATAVAGGAAAQFFGASLPPIGTLLSILTAGVVSTLSGTSGQALISNGSSFGLSAVAAAPASACNSAGNALLWTGSTWSCATGYGTGVAAGGNNSFTGLNTFSGATAAGTPALFVSFSAAYAGTTPSLLVGGTSSAFSASGTGLGVNMPSGFAGNLADLQTAGASKFSVTSGGSVTAANTISSAGGFNLRTSSATRLGQVSGANGDLQVSGSSLTQLTVEFDPYGHMITGWSVSGNQPVAGTGTASLSGGGGGAAATGGSTYASPYATDNAMALTTGTSVTSASVTFGHPWLSSSMAGTPSTAVAPICTATPVGTTPMALSIVTTSTTVTVYFASAVTAQGVHIRCGL